MFQTKCVEKVKAYILYLMVFYEILAVFKIIWKSMLEPDGPQMTI